MCFLSQLFSSHCRNAKTNKETCCTLLLYCVFLCIHIKPKSAAKIREKEIISNFAPAKMKHNNHNSM